MNKSEFVSKVAAKSEMSNAQAGGAVNAVLVVVQHALESGGGGSAPASRGAAATAGKEAAGMGCATGSAALGAASETAATAPATAVVWPTAEAGSHSANDTHQA